MQEGMLDHQEIEWQLDASDLERVGAWLEDHPNLSGLNIVPAETKELTDTYYDTDDWRLYRAGYALRVRRDGERAEATMKSLATAENALKRRREISEPLEGGGEIPKGTGGPVGERLRRLAGDLRPLFEVRTRRRTFTLWPESTPTGPDGVVEDAAGDIRRAGVEREGAVGELALDESEFSGEEPLRLKRVEIEVSSEHALHDGVGGFVETLRGALGLGPAGASKFRTGLTAARLSPAVAPDLGTTQVDASMTAGEVAFAILRRHFAAVLAHEPGVRLGEDAEELHDMRVATRRLRAALKLYAEALPKRAGRYERDLRSFANALGEVRDLDVHLERLAGEGARNGDAIEEVAAVLEERRTEARRRVLRMLDSNRYERFVANFSGTLRRGRSPAPTAPILEAAPDLVRRRFRKVSKAADALSESSSPEDFHDLRKKGKRLRYALEPLQVIYGKPSEKMVELLKEIQDQLGDHQDLIVAAGLMRELGSAADLPPRTVFSMGSIAERHIRVAAELRADFLGSEQLRALKGGKPWKRLRKKMKKKAGG